MPLKPKVKLAVQNLEAHLFFLPDKVRDELAGKVRDQAERLAAAQRAAFQKLQKPPEETGGALASIRVERDTARATYNYLGVGADTKLAYVVRAGGPLSTRNGYDHVLAFEFGTVKQPARPFFYSTARLLNNSMRDEIAAAIQNVIDRG